MAAGIIGSIVGQLAGQIINQTLGSIMSQFGQGDTGGALANGFLGAIGGAIKNVIDQGPLPQFIKDAAKDVVDNIIGDNQQPTSPEAQDAVNECCGEQFEEAGRNFFEELLHRCMENGRDEDESEEAGDTEGGGKGGGNWLVAIAKALGSMAGEYAADMVRSAEKMADINGAESAKELESTMGDGFKVQSGGENSDAEGDLKAAKAQAMSQVQAEMQAQAQMFKMVSEATSTSIKSIGEGLSSMARKQ